MTSQDENLKKVDKAAEKYAPGDTAKRDKFRDKMDDILKDAKDQHLSDAQMDALVTEIEKIADKRDKDIDTVRKQAQEKLKELREQVVREQLSSASSIKIWDILGLGDLSKNGCVTNEILGFLDGSILALPELALALMTDSEFRAKFGETLHNLFLTADGWKMLPEGIQQQWKDLITNNPTNDPTVAYAQGKAAGAWVLDIMAVGGLGVGIMNKATNSVKRKAATEAVKAKVSGAAPAADAATAGATPAASAAADPAAAGGTPAPAAPHTAPAHPADAGASAGTAPHTAPDPAGAPHTAAAGTDPAGVPVATPHTATAVPPVAPAIVTISKVQQELTETLKAIKNKRAQLTRLQKKDLPTPDTITHIELLTSDIAELERARDILRATVKDAAPEATTVTKTVSSVPHDVPPPEYLHAMESGEKVKAFVGDSLYEITRVSETEYAIADIHEWITITLRGESDVTRLFEDKVKTLASTTKPSLAPEPAPAVGVSAVPAAPDILSRVQALKVGQEATFTVEDITIKLTKMPDDSISMSVSKNGKIIGSDGKTFRNFSLDDANLITKRMKSNEYMTRIELTLIRHRTNLARLKTEPSTPELESRIAALEGKIKTGEDELAHMTDGGEPRLPLPEATARSAAPTPEPAPTPAPAAATAPVALSETATARIAELRKTLLADSNKLEGLRRELSSSTNPAQQKIYESQIADLRERITANETELTRLEAGGDVIGATPTLATRASQIRQLITADEETLAVLRTRNGSPAQIKKLTDRIEKQRKELARLETVAGDDPTFLGRVGDRISNMRGAPGATLDFLRKAKQYTIDWVGKYGAEKWWSTSAELLDAFRELRAENTAKVVAARGAVKVAEGNLKSWAERHLWPVGEIGGKVFNKSKEAVDAQIALDTARAALKATEADERVLARLVRSSWGSQYFGVKGNLSALTTLINETIRHEYEVEEADLNKQIEEYKKQMAAAQAPAPVAPVPAPAPAPAPVAPAVPVAPAPAPTTPAPAATVPPPPAPGTGGHAQAPAGHGWHSGQGGHSTDPSASAHPRQSQTVHTSPDPQERQDALDSIAHSHDPLSVYQRKYIADAQQALKDKGLYTGRIDGIPGPLTQGALVAYRNGGRAPAGQPTQPRHPVYNGNIPENIMESGSGRIVMAQIGNEKYLIATGETSTTKANAARAFAQAGNNAWVYIDGGFFGNHYFMLPDGTHADAPKLDMDKVSAYQIVYGPQAVSHQQTTPHQQAPTGLHAPTPLQPTPSYAPAAAPYTMIGEGDLPESFKDSRSSFIAEIVTPHGSSFVAMGGSETQRTRLAKQFAQANHINVHVHESVLGLDTGKDIFPSGGDRDSDMSFDDMYKGRTLRYRVVAGQVNQR